MLPSILTIYGHISHHVKVESVTFSNGGCFQCENIEGHGSYILIALGDAGVCISFPKYKAKVQLKDGDAILWSEEIRSETAPGGR